MKNIKLESLKSIVKEELKDSMPVAFANSVFLPPKKINYTFIAIKAYQTTQFEKFETDGLGYFKPISKCFSPEFMNRNSHENK